MDQALIDRIVSSVLEQLQQTPARAAIKPQMAPPGPVTAAELAHKVITADLLADSIRPGQSLRIGRKSILTPAAKDWLKSRQIAWTRDGSETAATAPAKSHGARWQLIVQTVTPNVRSLREALQRRPEGWTQDLVGQPLEAVTLSVRALSTADRDGVVVVSEFAEIIACRANRHDRVRAAVIADRRQLELTSLHLGVNLVCINPNGRTFIELRNLLQDCAATKPAVPKGWTG